MPKPQRQKNIDEKMSEDYKNSTNLANEVKRIKLTREPITLNAPSQTSFLSSPLANQSKRSIEDMNTSSSNNNKFKRQRIQWP